MKLDPAKLAASASVPFGNHAHPGVFVDDEGISRLKRGENPYAPGSDIYGHYTVYRGIPGYHHEELDYNNLGRHWSRSPGVAFGFAIDNQIDELYEDDDALKQPGYLRGTVLSARVPWTSVVHHNTPEWKTLSEAHQIFGPEHREQELTVRDGDPLKVTRAQDLDMFRSAGKSDYEQPEVAYDGNFKTFGIKGNA